jgi:hypothetical protein
MRDTDLNSKYRTYCWHYTTVKAWNSILASGFLKSRSLLISETLQAREDWQELKHNREALMQVLPPYLKAPHSPLRRKGMIFFSNHPHFEAQAGLLTEVKSPNCAWSRREDAREEILLVGMRRLFERGEGLVRLGMPKIQTLSWEKLLNDAGVGLIEKMELHCVDDDHDFHNARYVRGITAAKIPLTAISCVEVCVPSPDESTCVWIPFLHPRISSIVVDDPNLAMLEAKTAAIAEMKALIDRGKNIVALLGHIWEFQNTEKYPQFFSLEQQQETMVTGFAM